MLRSRWAAGMVCPDPLEDEEAFVTWLETLGPRLPQLWGAEVEEVGGAGEQPTRRGHWLIRVQQPFGVLAEHRALPGILGQVLGHTKGRQRLAKNQLAARLVQPVFNLMGHC